MNFSYLGYDEGKKIVKGTLSAANEEVAGQVLAHNGYRVLTLERVTQFMPDWEKLFPSFFRVKPEAIIMFSRQLALLLESGIDIVTALELLQVQASNRRLKRVLGEIVSDLRSGNRLSVALDKHPRVFPAIYRRSLGVGEQSGGLETVLRQVADYMEREAITTKGIKNALRYPAIVSVVAVVVIAVLIVFVLPSFIDLYSSLGAELPSITKMLIAAMSWLTDNGLYLLGVIGFIGVFIFAYIRTPAGRYEWDKLMLKLPLMGRVIHLNELARCCRSMSLLFRSGLPLPEIMSLVVDSSDNRMMKKALADVQQDMIRGEGLSRPMAKHELFLPMMVQMVGVGEETGNLDVTLMSVAQSYETEAEDKVSSLIGLIQPAMTIVIGLVVAFIALSLVSAMYSVYGQL